MPHAARVLPANAAAFSGHARRHPRSPRRTPRIDVPSQRKRHCGARQHCRSPNRPLATTAAQRESGGVDRARLSSVDERDELAASNHRRGIAATKNRPENSPRRHGDTENEQGWVHKSEVWEPHGRTQVLSRRTSEPSQPALRVSVSPCLRVSVSPCLRVSVSPW
jgi:hypothetical protein